MPIRPGAWRLLVAAIALTTLVGAMSPVSSARAQGPVNLDGEPVDTPTDPLQPLPDSGGVNALAEWTIASPDPSGGGFPRGVEINPTNGQILVASRTADRIDVFDAGGNLIDTLLDGLVRFPQGIEIANGELFVAEEGDIGGPGTEGYRISVWSLTGTFQRAWGTRGSGNGQFNEPCDVAISSSGRVYVTDTLNQRIQYFNSNGTYVGQWGSLGGGNGQFQMHCTHSGLEIYGDEVYVVDSVNNRVQVFDLTGNYMRQWGTLGSGAGQFSNPTAIDIVNDLVYVTDNSNDRIEVFTPAGLYEGSITDALLDSPISLKVDPSGQVLWVTTNDNALLTFTTWLCQGFSPTHVGSSYGDRFIGSSADDIAALGPGNDWFRGGVGDDRVCGDTGHDDIRGQGGNDTIDGGAGDDRLQGAGGTDTVLGRGGADTIDGQGAADVLNGGRGDDTINGQNGADTIIGGEGNDTLKSQSGPDSLEANEGDDELFGGNGNDTMFGGAGFDKCAGNLGPADQAESATCEQTPGVEVLF